MKKLYIKPETEVTEVDESKFILTTSDFHHHHRPHHIVEQEEDMFENNEMFE